MSQIQICSRVSLGKLNTMEYIHLNDDRLTYKQYDRLMSIMDHLSAPRPELEWNGIRRESKNLTNAQWQTKLTRELYITYKELHSGDEISREQVNDLFDDEYIDKLTSVRLRLKKWLHKKFNSCLSSKAPKKEGSGDL